MANEITLSIQAQLRNGDLYDTFQPPVRQIDQASNLATAGVFTIGTSVEAIDPGDIQMLTATPMVFIQNLDDTNFVVWGPDTGGTTIQDMGRLLPGDWACFRQDSISTLLMQADTATCNVLVKMWDD